MNEGSSHHKHHHRPVRTEKSGTATGTANSNNSALIELHPECGAPAVQYHQISPERCHAHRHRYLSGFDSTDIRKVVIVVAPYGVIGVVAGEPLIIVFCYPSL